MTELWETYMDPIASGSQGMQGLPGNDATAIDVGTWHSGHPFVIGDRCYHAKSGYGQCVYRCTSSHTSSVSGGTGNEPEVGDSWATKWELFAAGGANGAGTGDIVGPASSTTDFLAVYADVSGKLLKAVGNFATYLVAGLSALTASTTATDGDVDSIAVKESGGWKLKTLDSVFQRWVPVDISAGALIASGTTPCGTPTGLEQATNKHNYKTCSFSNSAKSYGWFNFLLPAGYTGGTIKGYVNWFSDGTTSNGVRFGLQGNAIGDNESLDPTWGTAVEVTDNATGTANRHLKTSIMDAITLGGTPTAGKMCSMRIYRDPIHGDDNLNAIIYVTFVHLLIPINKQSEV
jgi:hypothetical protein